MIQRTHQHPRVSVIIPVYNGASYINESLQSVFHQTYSDYEIIVADDRSTDNLLELLKPYEGRITILSFQHRGVSATRNEAIRRSHGEFIALLDADDIWVSDKLEAQIEYLDDHPEYGLVYAYSTNFTGKGDGDIALVKKIDFEGYIFKDIFTKACFYTGTIVMRRYVFDDIGGYDETLAAMEDYELNLRISQKYQIGRVPKSLLYRRIHPDSFYSSGYDNQYIYQLPVYDKLMTSPEVESEIGMSREDYMSGFILKFIFKNLFDNRREFIDQKLRDLESYSSEMAVAARKLVIQHAGDLDIWRPLIRDFDTWYADVKYKAILFNSREGKR